MRSVTRHKEIFVLPPLLIGRKANDKKVELASIVEGKVSRVTNILQEIEVREGWFKDFAQNEEDEQKPPRVRHKLPKSNLKKAKDRIDEGVERKPNSYF